MTVLTANAVMTTAVTIEQNVQPNIRRQDLRLLFSNGTSKNKRHSHRRIPKLVHSLRRNKKDIFDGMGYAVGIPGPPHLA